MEPEQQQQQQQQRKEKKEELSEEDVELQETLGMLVQRVQDPDIGIQKAAIDSMKSIIRSSTSSMTSVPKPLKFLRDQVPSLTRYWDTVSKDSPNKPILADILSVLHMCIPSDQSERSVLFFQIQGTREAIDQWGHEYVKHLAMEIVSLYTSAPEAELEQKDLLAEAINLAIKQIVPFFLAHNSEPDACDLLVELERLDLIPGLVTRQNYARICLYLVSCASYEPFPYNNNILQTVHEVYRKMGKLPEAVYIAVRLNDSQLVLEDLFVEPADSGTQELVQRQLCYIISRYPTMAAPLISQLPTYVSKFSSEQFAKLMSILRNDHYARIIKSVGESFGLLDNTVAPKAPEDVYKSHLDSRPTDPSDSAKVACSNALVNGFINMSLYRDRFLIQPTAEQSNSQADAWIYKPKNEGIICAVASIGCICRGDLEQGLSYLDRYFESPDPAVRAGAVVAVGLLSGGACIRDECDAGFALVVDHLTSSDVVMRESAITSLLFAYSGTANPRVQELLIPIVTDTSMTLWTVALSCLAMSNAFVGSCDGEITSIILQILMEREADFALSKQPFRLMALSLGLLYWGRQGAADTAIETVRVLASKEMSLACSTIVTGCAYAGSGNVMQIQQLLHLCSISSKESAKDENAEETSEEQKDDSKPESNESSNEDYRGFAVLGVALISSGEEVGTEMALRLMNHLMYYGNAATKRAVPLALALSSASNPQVPVIDVLSKYSHDGDKQIALAAVLALGIVGAGTGNSRIGNLLRALANFYYKDQLFLSAVKVSQGILHASRGLYTLHPLSHYRTLMDCASMSSLLTYLVCLGDSEDMLFSRYPYLHYLAMCAMTPRYLSTVDSSGTPVKVMVRLGTAVDTVGLAGTPKTISAFQTHSTPVLVGCGERAELARGITERESGFSGNWQPISSVLEGIVVVQEADTHMAND